MDTPQCRPQQTFAQQQTMEYAILLCLLGCAHAQYLLPFFPPQIQLLPPPVITSTQFHAQDELGRFNFAYAGNSQFRTESKLLDGSVRGSYSYIDANNKLIDVQYIADSNGFRVLGANNLPTVPVKPDLPQPVDYTPEVAAARAQFEKAYELAAQGESPSSTTEPTTADDEVAESRRRKRSILLPALLPSAVNVRVSEVEPVKDVVTPADTTAVEIKETERTLPALVSALYHPSPAYGYVYAL